eukprot:RCo038524
MSIAFVGEGGNQLLRREVYLVNQRRIDTEQRLRVVQDREKRLVERENARKFGKVKPERVESDNGPNKRPKITSLVALPQGSEDLASKGAEGESVDPTGDKKDPVDPVEVSGDASGKPEPRPQRRLLQISDAKRDRKLMGFLMGHLNKSRQEFESRPEASRSLFEQKMLAVDAKIADQQREAFEREQRLLTEEKAKQSALLERLSKRQEQLQKAVSRVILEEHQVCLANFLETKATPKLYYLPSHHTAETRRRVEERRSAALARYSEFRAHLDALVADVRDNSIEKLMPYSRVPLMGGGLAG